MNQLLLINRERFLYTSKFTKKKPDGTGRTNLYGVYFVEGTLVATDGHYLVEFQNSFKQQDSASGEHQSYLLRVNKDIQGFLKNSKSEFVELVEEATCYYLKDGNNLQFIEAIPEDFPNYKEIIPMETNKGVNEFTISATLLKDFEYDKQDFITIQTGESKYTPLRIRSKKAGMDMLGLLMPVMRF